MNAHCFKNGIVTTLLRIWITREHDIVHFLIFELQFECVHSFTRSLFSGIVWTVLVVTLCRRIALNFFRNYILCVVQHYVAASSQLWLAHSNLVFRHYYYVENGIFARILHALWAMLGFNCWLCFFFLILCFFRLYNSRGLTNAISR